MAKAPFTDVFIRALEPPSKGQAAWWDTRLPSFGVRVSQGGSKAFVLNRKGTFITLGRYPLISLSEAREQARKILADPYRPNSPIPYRDAVEAFLREKGKSRRPVTAGEYRYWLEKLNLASVQASHLEVERALQKIKSPSSYSHALVAARVFFNWCIKRRFIEHNPTAGLSPHAAVPRARILTDEELVRIWKACEAEKQKGSLLSTPSKGGTMEEMRKLPPSLHHNFACIVQLLLLTGQRRGEISALQSSWIKENIITLPARVTKNGREHCIPLSVIATSTLRPVLNSASAEKSTFLFPARGRPDKPFNGWSKSKAALDKVSGVTGWTLHDLRRTYRSNLGRIGVAPHLAERLVNHISSRSAVDIIYDRHTYATELRLAVDSYEQFLHSIGVG
jgi:integrase